MRDLLVKINGLGYERVFGVLTESNARRNNSGSHIRQAGEIREANLIPLTMCTRRNLLTFPRVPPLNTNSHIFTDRDNDSSGEREKSMWCISIYNEKETERKVLFSHWLDGSIDFVFGTRGEKREKAGVPKIRAHSRESHRDLSLITTIYLLFFLSLGRDSVSTYGAGLFSYDD